MPEMEHGTGPQLPSVLVGMSRAQWEREQFFETKQPTFPPGVVPIVVDKYIPPEDSRLRDLMDKQVLVPDVVLVRSPFNTGRYVPENRAWLEFQREKMELVARLCRLLGAVKVESLLETLELASAEHSGRFNIGKKVAKANVFNANGDFTLKDQKTAREELTMSRTFPASSVQIEEAQRFLSTHNLHDPEIQGIVEARSGDAPATRLQVKVTFEASQDRALKVSGGLKLPGWFADGAYEQKRKYQQRVSMRLDITFKDKTPS